MPDERKTKKELIAELDKLRARVKELEEAGPDQSLADREERYRSLFEDSPISLWEEDFTQAFDYIKRIKARGVEDVAAFFMKNPGEIAAVADMVKVIDVNRASLELFSASSKQELIDSLGKVFGEGADQVFARALEAAAQNKQSFQAELPVKDLAGNSKWVLTRWIASFARDGTIRVYVAMVDLSERKKAEEELAGIGKAVESTGDAVMISTPTGRIIYMNRACRDIFGYTLEEINEAGGPPVMYEQPDQARQIYELIRKSHYFADEVSLKRKDGRIIPAYLRADAIKDPSGKVTGLIAVATDITELKRAENALVAECSFRNAIIEHVAEGLCVCHDVPEFPYVRFTVWNDRMTEITGYDMDEINHLGWYQSVYPDPELREKAIERMDRMRNGDDIMAEEWEITRKNGEKRVLLISTSVVESQEGAIHVLAMMADVTARKRAERALEQEKERLSVTLRAIGDGVITTDTDGTVVLMNKVAEKLTGYDQDRARGRHISDVFDLRNEKPGETWKNVLGPVLEKNGASEVSGHSVLVSADGQKRLVEHTTSPIKDADSKVIGSVLVFRDVTEKARLDEELARAEKLESLGIMAGGIAHDFNNLLTGILGNISLARAAYAKEDGPLKKRLAEAEKGCYLARNLTQQLLTFSKGGTPIKKTSSMADILKESAEFALRGSGSTCRFDIKPGLWPVVADAGQISQVVQNLIINADQSMPDGGEISVVATNVVVPEQERVPGLEPGPYNKIIIRDQGMGIREDHLARIFDPFFTTKQTGSGLGLATSYSIINKHQGHIEAKSKQGEGTEFRIWLPASPGMEEPERPEEAAPQKGAGRILVMEDESSIVELLAIMLPNLGYQAEFASSGEEALYKYERKMKEGTPFHAVIMDLTIPGGMGGREAVGKLLELDPEAKVIVSSGYSTDPVMADYRSYGFQGAIAKPYKMADVGRVLSGLLDRQS